MAPGPKNRITDVAGLTVGNATDHALRSGVTVVLCEEPSTAAVQVLGGAPGTRETDLLEPHNTVQTVDALVLSGGSAFGLDAASGVQAGGRTGLTALVVAVLFLAALFIAPLAGSVPAYATAPALLYVAGLMMRELIDIDWSDVTEATPAALTALIMPFTYSIAHGLAFGFIGYVVLNALTGKFAKIHAATWLVAALFVVRYAYV